LTQLTFLYKLVDGIASSSLGTHVASLAGVPLPVVQRAEVISDDFAKQFKNRIENKQKSSSSARLSLDAQADFAYLFGVAMGRIEMPQDPVKSKQILQGLKAAARRYIGRS
jgi:DNA mismatch repair protein MSH6